MQNDILKFISRINMEMKLKDKGSNSSLEIDTEKKNLNLKLDDDVYTDMKLDLNLNFKDEKDMLKLSEYEKLTKRFQENIITVKKLLNEVNDCERVNNIILKYIKESDDIETVLLLLEDMETLSENDLDICQEIISIIDPER